MRLWRNMSQSLNSHVTHRNVKPAFKEREKKTRIQDEILRALQSLTLNSPP